MPIIGLYQYLLNHGEINLNVNDGPNIVIPIQANVVFQEPRGKIDFIDFRDDNSTTEPEHRRNLLRIVLENTGEDDLLAKEEVSGEK